MLDLSSAINIAIEKALMQVHTCLPGIVEEYDDTQGATIKPLIKWKTPDNKYIELPSISGVPVIFPGTGNFFMIAPIEKNTPVLLFFAERSIDEWVVSGKMTEPRLDRKFDLSDAFALPGAFSLNNTPKPSKKGNVEISYKGTKIVLNKDGKIAIGTNGAELLDTFSELISTLMASTVATISGPQPLSSLIDGSLLKLKVLVDSIKGTLK